MTNENFNQLQNKINRRIVELTAGGFSGPRAVLERYAIGNAYVATNSFGCRVIEQCCDRLGLTYSRFGNTYIVV